MPRDNDGNSEVTKRLVIFLGIVVAVVMVSGVSTYLEAGLESARSDTDIYDTSDLTPNRLESSGRTDVNLSPDTGVVAVDLAHSNRITRDGIDSVVSTVTETGYEVEYLEERRDLGETLSRADAFVVADPGRSYSEREINAVESFVDDGGRLLLLGEPSDSRLGVLGTTSEESYINSLASRFGLRFGSDYLYNMEPDATDGNYKNVLASGRAGSEIADGVDRISTYTATHVSSTRGVTVATAVPGTRRSGGDSPGAYSVSVVNGNVLGVGDTTFLEGGKYNVADNEVLISNIAEFLVSGDRRRDLLDYPYVVGDDATVRYTSHSLASASVGIRRDLKDAGRRSFAVYGESPSPSNTDVLVTTYGFLRGKGMDTDVPSEFVESQLQGSDTVVVTAPDSGYDLVVAGDTPENVRTVARNLPTKIDAYAVTDSRAVIPVSEAESETDSEAASNSSS